MKQLIILLIVSGVIKLKNYEDNEDKSWPVHSDCQSVRIRSKMFETEKKYDYVTVAEIQYSGKKRVDMIINSNHFVVAFRSDDSTTDTGFVFNWNCLNWGEWTSVGSGSCKKERWPQPEYNGADKDQYIQYENMEETCSKFIYFIKDLFLNDMDVIQNLLNW